MRHHPRWRAHPRRRLRRLTPGDPQLPALTPLEESVLAIERGHPTYGGAKDDAIRQRLNLSATAYFQVLNALMDRPEAMEHSPQIIGRLRRIRDQKRDGERAQRR